MKRVLGLMFLSVLWILAIPASAQEASPPPGEPPDSFELAPGVTADDVVFTEGQESPSLYRLHFDPGVSYEVAASPNLEIAYVVEGSLIVRLDGPVIVGAVGAEGTPGEAVSANEEVTVTAGQYIVLQPGVSGEVRNEGEETAVVAVAGVTPGGLPGPATATPSN